MEMEQEETVEVREEETQSETEEEQMYEIDELLRVERRPEGWRALVRWAGVDGDGEAWPDEWIPLNDLTPELLSEARETQRVALRAGAVARAARAVASRQAARKREAERKRREAEARGEGRRKSAGDRAARAARRQSGEVPVVEMEEAPAEGAWIL